MELKMKYQYTNFIYPYIVEERKYNKYLLKLLKNKSCEIKFFEKEKDINLYRYFLPNIRKFMFCDFSFNKNKIEKFKKMDLELQSTVLSKYPCTVFEYKINENLQGKVEKEDGIFFKINSIQIICFSTGICFIVFKTHIENSNEFEDVINFNYKFRNINLKNDNNDKIKIQTDSFENMKTINEIINLVIEKNNYNEKLDIDNEKFMCYTYTCIEQESWNENNNFNEIKNEFYKFSNILPSNFNVRTEDIKADEILKIKFAKIGTTKISTALLTSGIDTFNYTKLPYIFENEYFYTYILELYKKIYIKKIALNYKEKNIENTRKEFIEFTKNIWTQEITNEMQGNNLIKKWDTVLELDKDYDNLKNKYNLLYKEANIEKNSKVNKVILIILIISLIINIINFGILFK